jgi:hypothetical protein
MKTRYLLHRLQNVVYVCFVVRKYSQNRTCAVFRTESLSEIMILGQTLYIEFGNSRILCWACGHFDLLEKRNLVITNIAKDSIREKN